MAARGLAVGGAGASRGLAVEVQGRHGAAAEGRGEAPRGGRAVARERACEVGGGSREGLRALRSHGVRSPTVGGLNDRTSGAADESGVPLIEFLVVDRKHVLMKSLKRSLAPMYCHQFFFIVYSFGWNEL